jgi:hypothetical protein
VNYLHELGHCVVIGVIAGLTIAVASVIVDEVRGYFRMKRFAKAAAAKRTGKGLFSE